MMPNHWHMVIWAREDGELTEFLRWLTQTQTMRWHAHFGTLGTGHLYQGRFQSFHVESDEHFFTVVRDVERNAVRANLVARAEPPHGPPCFRGGKLVGRYAKTCLTYGDAKQFAKGTFPLVHQDISARVTEADCSFGSLHHVINSTTRFAISIRL